MPTSLGVIGQVKLWRRDAAKLGPCAPMSPFGLVFMDPPYGKGLAEKALAALVSGQWLEPVPLSWSKRRRNLIWTCPQTSMC
jgi:16S rRNA (guanine966-N2)-methyltransferase